MKCNLMKTKTFHCHKTISSFYDDPDYKLERLTLASIYSLVLYLLKVKVDQKC